MDYSWGVIPVASFLLAAGYMQRRSTLPKKDRYRILLIIDGGCIVLYAAAFYRSINAFHVAVFVGLALSLAIVSGLLYRYESRVDG
jgi:uncharacterized membrane protein